MDTFHPFGFSLIELMIVIAIISILSMIALPSYQQYTKRARFAEVINATEIFKTAVALALQEGIPIENLENGNEGIPLSPPETKNLTSIMVSKGTITATGSNLVNNDTYILIPNNDGTQWTLQGTCLNDGFCNQ